MLASWRLERGSEVKSTDCSPSTHMAAHNCLHLQFQETQRPGTYITCRQNTNAHKIKMKKGRKEGRKEGRKKEKKIYF